MTNVFSNGVSITFVNTFAERLRIARESRKLKQPQLAKAAGLSQSAISNYETQRRASSRGILKLAVALKVNPVWLAEGIGQMELSTPDAFMEGKTAEQQIKASEWPFVNVLPGLYFGLSREQQLMIEDMILAMAKRNMDSE